MANKMGENGRKKEIKMEKSYIEVVGMCCSSEVPLIEKILKSIDGVIDVTVIVPSRTVIVFHDSLLVSQLQLVKALNQAKLEANIKVGGRSKLKGKRPSPFVILSGILLSLSFLKYVYHPLQWLAVLAVALGIWPVLVRCTIAVRNLTLDANILMFIAVVGTLVLRDFTESATIVFLFTISEWLGMRASHKATAVMSSLMSMAPQKATIAETGEVVNIEDVKLNTVIAVKTGEIIPVDGVVLNGNCEVDEKALTGESFPVPKTNGDTVRAGTVNVNGYVEVETTAIANDSTVAKMARLVEEAQSKKSSVQRLIDTIAKYYTPVVVLTAAGLAGIPAILKVSNLSHWFHLSLVVLVSGCPCGLILSTPVATFCALSRAATSGLLIKGGDYLETLARLKFVALDKTGTLTRGEFTVEEFRSVDGGVSLSSLLYWVSSIESKSGHPIAAVLVEYARSKSVEPKPENVEDFQDFPGEGVSGKIDGKRIFVGNQKLGERANFSATSDTDNNPKEIRTSGYIYCSGAVIGTFSLSDNCRTGAKEAIRDLKSLGIKTALLTGDSQFAATHAQEQLEQALDEVHAELMPEDKAKIIQGYKNNGTTAMVGDGVNDAPALITADIGISMGVSGTALANEASHVVLMSNDIRKIPKAIKLARRTRTKVVENIVISIGTKVGVLAFAVAGHPLVWLAVVADVVTCLIVILNSMLILSGRGTHHGKKCRPRKTSCGGPVQCGTGCLSRGCEYEHLDESQECGSECHSGVKTSGPCEGNADSCDGSKACDTTCCDEDHCCVDNSRDQTESSCCGDEKCGTSVRTHSNTADDSSRSEHHVTIDTPSYQTEQEITPVDDHEHELNKSKSSDHIPINDNGLKCHSHGTHDHGSNHHGTHAHGSHHHGTHAHDHGSHHHHGAHTHGSNHHHGTHTHGSNHHHGTHTHGSHHHGTHAHNHGSHLQHGVHDHGSHHHHGTHTHGSNHHHGTHTHGSHNQHGTHSHGSHRHHETNAMLHGLCHGVESKHGCSSLRKREVRSCCRSYRKTCCGASRAHLVPGFGGLTEIVTE